MEPVFDSLSKWGRDVLPLIATGKHVRLSEVFFGLGGVVELLDKSGVSVELVNSFELDDEIAKWHRKLVGLGLRRTKGSLWSGKDVGDMMRVPVEALLDSDVLAAGPPCQAWAPGGQHGGEDDERSHCYSRIVEWVVELAHRGCLKAYFLENGEGIMQMQDGRQPFAEKILPLLAERVPFFRHGFVTVSPNQIVPVRRTRTWLRGVRVDLLGTSVPAPWQTLGIPPITLEALFEKHKQPTVPERLRKQEQKHLKRYLNKMTVEAAWGSGGRVACFELDRDPAATDGYKGHLTYDIVPPMRCKGPPYFLASTWDIHLPVEERAFFRLVTKEERFLLAGYTLEYASLMGTPTAMLKATGNAYPLAMAAQVVCPVFEVLCQAGAFAEGVRNLTKVELEELCEKVYRASAAVARTPPSPPGSPQPHKWRRR